MKIKKLSLSLLALLATALPLTAQTTAYTDPVGYNTVTVNAASDGRLSAPFDRKPAFIGEVASVSGSVATLTGAAFTASAYVNTHFIRPTSGTLEGRWFTITANGTGDITTAEDLATLGLAAGDKVRIIPFWTLNTMLPSGGGIDVSPDPFNPSSLVLTTDRISDGINIAPNKSYLYHDGSMGPAGWYDNGNLGAGLQNDKIIQPDEYLVIRNYGGSQKALVVAGHVPTSNISSVVFTSTGTKQDNFLMPLFPIPVSLANIGLPQSGAFSASPDPFNPTDLLLVYNDLATGYNQAPNKSYLYHDGSMGPAGWYDNGNLGAGLQDALSINPGVALIIRKASGVDSSSVWTSTIPYSLP